MLCGLYNTPRYGDILMLAQWSLSFGWFPMSLQDKLFALGLWFLDVAVMRFRPKVQPVAVSLLIDACLQNIILERQSCQQCFVSWTSCLLVAAFYLPDWLKTLREVQPLPPQKAFSVSHRWSRDRQGCCCRKWPLVRVCIPVCRLVDWSATKSQFFILFKSSCGQRLWELAGEEIAGIEATTEARRRTFSTHRGTRKTLRACFHLVKKILVQAHDGQIAEHANEKRYFIYLHQSQSLLNPQ